MTDLFLSWLERRGSHKVISRNGDPYMERYYLFRAFGCALFLHRFWRSDPDGVHCHPWPFVTMIQTGWYWEETIDNTLTYCPAWKVRVSQAQRLHGVRITDEMRGKVWTLFWHGRRWREWGFITEPGKPWQAAKALGQADGRPMKGVFFPRFVS